MGKNKLKKFDEMNHFSNVFQYPFAAIKDSSFPLKGKWNSEYFHNSNPIVLELGCGKGEYAVGMARHFPNKNFIGVDIKGARMWTGAKDATINNVENVAFLRTNIELITYFFNPGEVSEIWITFPDPQMKKVRKRLTSTTFINLYRQIMVNNGLIHLKTDSPFLYTYTDAMIKHNDLQCEISTKDLYNSDIVDDILDIKTFYEQQWLSRGMNIKYLRFHAGTSPLSEPDIEIEPDNYHSFHRNQENYYSSENSEQ